MRTLTSNTRKQITNLQNSMGLFAEIRFSMNKAISIAYFLGQSKLRMIFEPIATLLYNLISVVVVDIFFKTILFTLNKIEILN